MSSRKDKNELRKEVERLTRQLSRITIDEEIIERRLLLAKDNLENDMLEKVTQGGDILVQNISPIKSQTSLEQPQIGDFVRIINPKPGQENCGTIEGFYKDGKVKIRTKKGLVIRRLPHNIISNNFTMK